MRAHAPTVKSVRAMVAAVLKRVVSSTLGKVPSSLPVESADGTGHPFLLAGCQLGIDRQREHLAASGFRARQVARTVAERCEAWLQMQRHGVVDRRADPTIIEKPGQLVAS